MWKETQGVGFLKHGMLGQGREERKQDWEASRSLRYSGRSHWLTVGQGFSVGCRAWVLLGARLQFPQVTHLSTSTVWSGCSQIPLK